MLPLLDGNIFNISPAIFCFEVLSTFLFNLLFSETRLYLDEVANTKYITMPKVLLKKTKKL